VAWPTWKMTTIESSDIAPTHPRYDSLSHALLDFSNMTYEWNDKDRRMYKADLKLVNDYLHEYFLNLNWQWRGIEPPPAPVLTTRVLSAWYRLRNVVPSYEEYP